MLSVDCPSCIFNDKYYIIPSDVIVEFNAIIIMSSIEIYIIYYMINLEWEN